MRLLFVIIAWLFCVAVPLLLGKLGESWIEWIAAAVTQTASPSLVSPAMGIIVSILASIIAFAYVTITQNRHTQGVVRTYRWAEMALIKLERMKHSEILEYHRSYNWHAYAGLGFSAVFIVVPLLLDDKINNNLNNSVQYFALLLGLGLMAVSTVILGIVDLVHTNTLTPLMTSKRRFRIIYWVLVLGGAALAMQICAVGVLVSIFSGWLSVLSSLVALTLMVFMAELRGVPLAELEAERQLTKKEAQIVFDAGPGTRYDLLRPEKERARAET
jgi:hypothetical protein